MRKLSSLFSLLFFLFFLLSAISLPKQVYAQSCSGNPVCGMKITTVCNPTGCVPGSPGCNCTDQCGISGGTVTAACSGYSGTPGSCNASAICGNYAALCVKSGSCNYTPPSGGAVCGNGSCESGESTATCPGDCPSTGGGGGGSNGACGSCNSCGAANANECAIINGVCSKAGYCGGGGTSGPYCGNYSAYCGYSTGGACNNSGPNGPPYTCIYCPATKPDDAWQPLGTFQYANCTNDVCGGLGKPAKPVWQWSIPAGIANGATISPAQYYPFFSAPGGNVATKYLLYIDNHSVGAPNTYEFAQEVTGGELMYQNPRGWPFTYAANSDFDLIAYTERDTHPGCISDPLILSFTTNTTPSVTLTANPSTVLSGGSTTLTWSAKNVDACTASNGWSGLKALSGTEISTNITSSRTFTLVCNKASGGQAIANAVVTVSAVVTPPPTLTFTANPTTVLSGGSSTLNWQTTNATGCTGSGNWSGTIPLSGPQTVTNITSGQSYTLTCTGPGGNVVKTVNINVGTSQCQLPAPLDPAPAICALNPPTQNGSITWTWPAVAGADQYSFDVVDATTGVSIAGIATGMVNGQSNFNCRPNQPTPDLCSYKTVLPVGSYRSVIRSGNSSLACTTSNAVTFPAVINPGISVSLCPAVAWWQSGNGSVFTQGNIQSIIPASCTPPTCINKLIQDASGIPGIAIGGSSAAVQTGTGSISSKDWLAKSPITGRIPDYNSFVSLIPASITPSDTGATCGGGTFNSGGATTGSGYYWYRHNGDVTITSDVNLNPGRKVILYVDGNLTINGKISYNPANSYFMPIVKGNITVGGTVTSPAGTPTLTGIFYCDGRFDSSVGTGPLSVLGSVVAKGGVSLQRDLGPDNNFESAENFTISPDLMLNYPGELSFKRPVWREVAP